MKTRSMPARGRGNVVGQFAGFFVKLRTSLRVAEAKSAERGNLVIAELMSARH